MRSNFGHSRRPWLLLQLAFAGALLGVLLAGMRGHGVPVARADDVKNADIVVQFDAQSAVVRPITFTGAISGLRALELTGLEVISTVTAFGPAVCSIEGVGCPAANCFCDAARFWGYNFWDGTTWQGYMVGAGSSVISQTGDAEGWRWGEFGMMPLPADQARAASAALDWLATQQSADGSYGTAGATADVMLAIGANGLGPATWSNAGGVSLLDYWSDDAIPGDQYTNNAAKFVAVSPASNAKLLLAAQSTGQDIQSFAGLDLASAIEDTLDQTSGVIGLNNWDQALGMLGLRVAFTEPLPAATVDVLAQRANDDGGWGYLPGGDSDTNSTALAVQALNASGTCNQLVIVDQAMDYLAAAQNDDGGFPYTPGNASDTNSTAFVVQAILAVGDDPHGPRWTTGGKSPLDFLLARQLPDGSFEWQAGLGGDQFATRQAVPALLNTSLAKGLSPAVCHTSYLPLVKN